MKRLLLPACILFALSACDSEEPADSQNAGTRAGTITRAPQDGRVTQPKRDPLAFTGRYKAANPATDDPIAVELYADGTFFVIPRIGNSISGTFSWDITGSVVTLIDGDILIGKYFVGDNFLRRADESQYDGVILRKPKPQPRPVQRR